MKVYVAGPYSQGDPVLNVRAAIVAADRLVALGHTPYVPHLTMLWHLVSPRPIDFWYAHDLEWLAACNALIRLSGPSMGADEEERRAKDLGLLVFHSFVELERESSQ